MDLYNADKLETWPVMPEDSRMIGFLLRHTSTAERRQANDILELFLTLGVPLLEAQAKVAELYSHPRVTAQFAKLPELNLSSGQAFALRQDSPGRRWNFLLASDRKEAKPFI